MTSSRSLAETDHGARSRIIDVHAHCVPAGFRDWLVQKGSTVGVEVAASEAGTFVRLPGGVETGVQFGWPSLTGCRCSPVSVVTTRIRTHHGLTGK